MPAIARLDAAPGRREVCAEAKHQQPKLRPDTQLAVGIDERFDRTYRNEMPDACLFEPIRQVQLLANEWSRIYDPEWPEEFLTVHHCSW